MYTGKKTFDVPVNSRINIMADGPFMAYGIEDKDIKTLLGPFNTAVWKLTTIVPNGITKVQVRPVDTKNTTYEFEVTRQKTRFDPVDEMPMEIPLDACRPPTMEEMVKKYVAVQFSNYAEERGQETFEESNDFDVDDDDDFVSPYELQEMVDEVPLQATDEPPKEEKQDGNAKPSNQAEEPLKTDEKQSDQKAAQA